jgi:uncharacterized protein YkwD
MPKNRARKAGIVLVVIVAIIGVWSASTFGILDPSTFLSEINPVTSHQSQSEPSDNTKTTPSIIPNNPMQQIRNSIESGKQVLGNVIQKTANTINPKPPPTREELYQYALNLVNQDRKIHGVGPVGLSNIASAQNHADDMLSSGYFSHWNTDGVKPYVTYTKFGGRGEMAENIGYVMVHCLAVNCYANSFDPFKEINDSEYKMMYDDAGSNWGHRDNIINPDHTHVNFGIAYDNERFYFVENFENDIVDWQITTLNSNYLHLAGQMPSGYSLDQINVFSDPSPKPLSSQDLDGTAPYNAGYYDQGELAGVILPQLTGDSYYPECGAGKTTLHSTKGDWCVDYTTYVNNSQLPNGIDITSDVSKWQGAGLHTIYVYLKKPDGKQVSVSSVTLEYLK